MGRAGQFRPSRRQALVHGASLAFWAAAPKLASAAGARDPRFLLVILRGGLDGLSFLAPTGDPDYARLRGDLAVPTAGDRAGLPLDGFFSLHPDMPYLHSLYGADQALFVHAVATQYRGRSHFDGQDILEGGRSDVVRPDDGWLNRALGHLPASGTTDAPTGLSIGPTVPLVMRGTSPVFSWAPRLVNTESTQQATIERLLDLYDQTDADLGVALDEMVRADRLVSGNMPKGANPKSSEKQSNRAFLETASQAAAFLSQPDGPRIGTLSYGGWDTHARKGVLSGQLAQRLKSLDSVIRTLRGGLGPVWDETIVAFVTEFGRTARVNGSKGTDHGTATSAFLAGGAVRGGRIVADWPGLGTGALFEDRDLAPTLDLRALFKGILRDHLAIPDIILEEDIFDGSQGVRGLRDIVAA